MKAIQLTETGGPEVMHRREIPTPIPQESEVLIRVAVTGVNFIDLYVREGRYGNELPFTPGQESCRNSGCGRQRRLRSPGRRSGRMVQHPQQGSVTALNVDL